MTTSGAEVLVEVDAGVMRLTLNRPHKKNALTLAMYDRLSAELGQASDDPQIRAVLFSGAGDSFTAGNDLADFMRDPPSSFDSPVGRFLTALVGFGKPLVAAVQGAAVGIGTTMLLLCDLVYAADTTRLQMPFTSLGLCPEAASSYLLPRFCGYARAAELLLLGEPFDAKVGHELGLVNRVLPAADLVEFATSRAQALAALPPAAVRVTKQLMQQGLADTVEQTMRREAEQFFVRLRSPEAAEAMSAFLAKRKPDFSRFT